MALNSNSKRMSLNELLLERLKITLGAIERDPAVAETLKAGFKTIYECLHEQRISSEIIQSELVEKASSTEMVYLMSQKLSVTEFLNYFQKIERVMGGFETQIQKQAINVEEVINEKCNEIDEAMEKAKKEMELRRKKKDMEVEKIKEDIREIVNMVSKVTVTYEQNKENLEKVNQSKKDKQQSKGNEEMLEELRVIQEYCEENRRKVDDLVLELKNDESRKSKKQPSDGNGVSFSDLRSIMSNLEADLNQSLQRYVTNLKPISRLIVSWKCEAFEPVSIIPSQIQDKQYEIGINEIFVLEAGIYKVVCGFFPRSKTQLGIRVNQTSVAHHVCEEPPGNSLARTMMLYMQIERESEVSLECRSRESVKGFLSLQRL